DPEPVLDVPQRVLAGQRLEVAANPDALIQLAELPALELLLQLGLADQDDLEQLSRGRLERGQDADLLERVHAHLLGLVEDDHHGLALGAGGEQMLAELSHQLALGSAAPLDPEVVEDHPDELGIRQMRVEDEGALNLLRQLPQERTAQRRLPRPHVADQSHEALLARDAVEERAQDLVMALGPEQKGRLGRENERRVPGAEDRLVPRRAPSWRASPPARRPRA